MPAHQKGKTVLLGVTGSIAAFKAPLIASALVKDGVEVITLMTESAMKFIQPLSFEAITRGPVVTSMWDARYVDIPESRHISLADRADLLLIAPATANIIAKLALGIADDILSCTAMATPAPIIIAPAMHDRMYKHPAVQHNIDTLRKRKVSFIGPAEGRLADGKVGTGRLAEIDDIVQAALETLSDI